MRRLSAWYYYRLIITVTPQQVWTEEPLAVRDPMVKAPVARRAAGPYREVIQRLPGYKSAVLSWLEANGAPASVRAVLSPTANELLRVQHPARHLRPGPASILCHSHDAKLWNQRSFIATGQLNTNGSDWTFSPQHFVTGMSRNPVAMIKFLHGARTTAHRYLSHRGLTKPTVPWAAYHRLET